MPPRVERERGALSRPASLLLLLLLALLALAATAPAASAMPVPAPGSRAGPARRKVAAAQPAWRAVERECRNSLFACGRVPRGVEDACVLRCQAPSCFAKVYGEYVDWLDAEQAARAEPRALEPGELDGRRQGKFSKCLRGVEKALRAAKRWPPTLRPGESALAEPEADTPPATPRAGAEAAADAEPEPEAEAEAPPAAAAGA